MIQYSLLVEIDPKQTVHSVAYSPDGRSLAVGVLDGFRVFRADNGQLVLRAYTLSPVLSVSWSPRLIGILGVWGLREQYPLGSIPVGVTHGALSPCGRFFAHSLSKSIKIIEMETSVDLRTLHQSDTTLGAMPVIWVHGGGYLLSARKGQADLWHVETKQQHEAGMLITHLTSHVTKTPKKLSFQVALVAESTKIVLWVAERVLPEVEVPAVRLFTGRFLGLMLFGHISAEEENTHRETATATSEGLFGSNTVAQWTPYVPPSIEELQATDALLIGQLKATYTTIVGSTFSSVSLKEPLIITTPNADYLPDINVEQVSVTMQRDGRWGAEDWTRWPQWFFEGFEYFAYILKPLCAAKLVNHPLWRIWWDMTERDFCGEVGTPGIGKLQSNILNEIKKLRQDLMNEVLRQEIDQECTISRCDSVKLQETATAMRHHFSTLEYLNQSYESTVATVTLFQRSFLETRALLDKIQTFNKRCFGCDEPKPWPVDNSLMGIVTDRVSLVQELYFKGVPVWFVRSANLISPTINIGSSFSLTPPILSNGVVVKPWPDAPVFYRGACAPAMYTATLKWRPGVVDLTCVELNTHPTAQQDSGALSAHALSTHQTERGIKLNSSNARRQRSIQSSSSKGGIATPYSRPKQPSSHISMNWDRFKPSISPNSSSSTPEWVEALRNVNSDQARCIDHSHEFLLAWIAIHTVWITTFTGFESRHVPLPGPQLWRTYLRDIALDLELVRKDNRRHTPQVPSSSRTSCRNQKSRDVIKDIFCIQKPVKESLTFLLLGERTIWTPGNVRLEPTDFKLVVWDSHEHNFRAEFMSLDRCIMANAYKDIGAGNSREHKLQGVFFDGATFMTSCPAGFKSIASGTPEDRCAFVKAFCDVLSDWPGETPRLLASLVFHKKQSGKDTWDFGIMCTAERRAYQHYCQTFFDYFGRAPTIPHTCPT
ncbi:hypothetical protein NP233_g6498 [Leucocoprinus birnbaumii]|uniref:Uncharacterized protein n=1 Tax=Leucocoprinus birnbaumii TaxID=56174 RepID=A0AAD5YTL7_9AGAR|nr:hypothetical protein NP233_g6498 [Leucocoprinus birnbaumii]